MKKKITTIIAAFAFFIPASSTLAYTSKPGDTMWNIATSHQLSLQELVSLNPQINDPDQIQVGQNINVQKQKSASIAADDRKLLAQLVHAEAKGEPFEGKVKVAKVILNRVKSPNFPDSIKEVIMQPGQFTPVQTGAIHNTPVDSDYQAVDKAVSTMNEDDGSLYFYNPDIAKSTWLQSKPTTEVIGNHVFKK